MTSKGLTSLTKLLSKLESADAAGELADFFGAKTSYSIDPDAFSDLFAFPTVSVKQTKTLSRAVVFGLTQMKEEGKARSSVAALATCCHLLSRDANHVDHLCTKQLVDAVLSTCAFDNYEHLHWAYDDETKTDKRLKIVSVWISLQKTICNCAFISTDVFGIIAQSQLLDGLVSRFEQYAETPDDIITARRDAIRWKQMYSSVKQASDPLVYALHEMRRFDSLLLFILTGKSSDMAKKLRNSSCLESLTTIYEQHVERPSEDKEDRKLILCEEDATLMKEVLKGMLNLLAANNWQSAKVVEQSAADLCVRIMLCGRRVLSMTVPTAVQQQHHYLVTHIANLITVLPHAATLDKLADPSLDICDRRLVMFHDWNMAPIVTLLELLDYRLKETANEKDYLVPVLFVLTALARHDYRYRKFLRFRLLPPLRGEVLRRPDEGDSFRNHLVRLMTDASNISLAAAELLFELCKRNVSRLIKYTGYGNAAGLLASHGLLLGGSDTSTTNDGGDSDDSDTEEYEQLKNRVNPITGFVEGDKPNPMEGMSEEQKEYEAMKLVEQMDKLIKEGVVKPGTVGEDGRVKAVEHVLELRKHVDDKPDQAEESDD